MLHVNVFCHDDFQYLQQFDLLNYFNIGHDLAMYSVCFGHENCSTCTELDLSENLYIPHAISDQHVQICTQKSQHAQTFSRP